MGIWNEANGSLTFRHPLIKEGNYNKIIHKRVGKLSRQLQARIADELEKLLELKPEKPCKETEECHEKTLDFYFGPLGDDLKDEEARKQTERWSRPGYGTSEGGYELYLAKKEIKELRAQISGLVSATGQLDERQKAMTLDQSHEHFKAHVRCKTEAAKAKLLRRVQMVLEQVGLDKKHCAVTKGAILDAIKALGGSATEKSYKIRDTKRFFRECAWPIHSDGLALPDPATGIKPERHRRGGDPETLDPKPLLDCEKLSPYWKAMTSCLGLAGLRLGEAASLEWEMLDKAAGIIRLRATRHYPQLKNEISERDVKPFTEFWRIMDKYKKVATHGVLVFPSLWQFRDKTKRNETWFALRDGQPMALRLPAAYRDAIELASGQRPIKPALRLRHFWVTAMAARGLAHLDPIMGGHSAEIGRKHYTKTAALVAAAKVGRLGKG